MRRKRIQLYIKRQKNDEVIFYFITSCLPITKKLLFWIFWRWKIWYFRAKKLMEIWYLLITKKFLYWSFREWEIRSFFVPKSWWKDGIYWLLKRPCFELFGYGKYGLFWVKKLIERWYLLVTEKFLFWTFRWWEMRSFFLRMIFTWSFWFFQDIPGLGKYGFSRSDWTVSCFWYFWYFRGRWFTTSVQKVFLMFFFPNHF